MNRCRVSFAASVIAAIAALIPAPHAGAEPIYREYVALGDSFSAGVITSLPPTSEFVPLDCGQSASDYPHQVAAALQVPVFRDATCGSAVTADMSRPQALPLGGINPPQFDRLSPDTDLVTLGIGGNDAGLAMTIQTCMSLTPVNLPGAGCQARNTVDGVDRASLAIAAAATTVRDVLDGIRTRSPHARIIMVDYLAVVPEGEAPGCWPVTGLTDTDTVWLSHKLREINAMLADVAREAGVEIVDTYTPSLGHDVCGDPDVRYVEGLAVTSNANLNQLAFPFHPNQRGANLQAELTIGAITGNSATR